MKTKTMTKPIPHSVDVLKSHSYTGALFSICLCMSFINPFMPSGFFYLNSLDTSISSKRSVRLINIITML